MHPKNYFFQNRKIKQAAMKAVPVDGNVTGKIHIPISERKKFQKTYVTEDGNICKNKTPY